MKMRKLIAAILCVVLTCFALASCAEDDIKEHAGEELDRYNEFYKPEVIVKLHYNLYIITEAVEAEAEDIEATRTTVQAKINQKLGEKYNTSVAIHYITADQYTATVNGVVDDLANAAGETNGVINGGNIVLVAGEEMYDSLVEKSALVDVRSYLDLNAYGKLNTQITPTLLDSAKTIVDGVEKLFFIPNDHVIGEYTYTVIDKKIAEGVLNFSAQTELNEMIIKDGEANDLAKELIDAYEANKENEKLKDITLDMLIREVKGTYADKADYEGKDFVCNVSKYPVVTREETFASGFGILTPPAYDYDIDGKAETTNADFLARRAMDIVYSINADVDVRNLLQYGVEHSNYNIEVIDGKNYVVPMEGNLYKMNLFYTGDMFNAYYCEENVWTIGGNTGSWTYDAASNGDKQNSESVIGE